MKVVKSTFVYMIMEMLNFLVQENMFFRVMPGFRKTSHKWVWLV